MKKILYFIIAIFCLTSCEEEIDLTISGVELYGSDQYDDHTGRSEFLSSELILEANFEFVDDNSYYSFRVDETVLNPVVEDKLVLTSDKDLIIAADTIRAGMNLLPHFDYKKLHKKAYLLRYKFRLKENVLNESGYYRFYLDAFLADETVVSDSCVVKIYQ